MKDLRQFATSILVASSSFLLLVAMPGAPRSYSVLAPSRNALCYVRSFLLLVSLYVFVIGFL